MADLPLPSAHLPAPRRLPVEHLRELVRLPTMSRTEVEQTDWAPFDAVIEALPRLYPALHGALTREIIADHSLLYRWKGTDDGPPTVLMAHYDVVPATEDGWEHPPFAAELTGGGEEELIWGRGTLDDKGSMVAMLEGV